MRLATFKDICLKTSEKFETPEYPVRNDTGVCNTGSPYLVTVTATILVRIEKDHCLCDSYSQSFSHMFGVLRNKGCSRKHSVSLYECKRRMRYSR